MAPTKQIEQPIRRLTKTVSMDLEMVKAIERKAREEGHSNFSRVVTSAVEAYLTDDEPKQQVA